MQFNTHVTKKVPRSTYNSRCVVELAGPPYRQMSAFAQLVALQLPVAPQATLKYHDLTLLRLVPSFPFLSSLLFTSRKYKVVWRSYARMCRECIKAQTVNTAVAGWCLETFFTNQGGGSKLLFISKDCLLTVGVFMSDVSTTLTSRW
jgi:hypothetical protein